ncbi:MAG: Transcription initiation protein spt3 [Vezdaea aestivalis]|nr:MAG: Transcription initiation protein spt3 [Vezdaea aestivalis]
MFPSIPSRPLVSIGGTSFELDSVPGPYDVSLEEFQSELTILFEQMMFVSGENGEVSVETTNMVEEIVRNQVIEILTQCHNLAIRRGVRTISTDDLFFVIRHNKGKVARLQSFLTWKDVRKNVKDSEDKAVGDAADFGVGDDPAGVGALGSGPIPEGTKEKRRPKVELPWDVSSFYSEQPPPLENEPDDGSLENDHLTLQRLRAADERTKNMTKEEYVHFSECRQASFTFRKGKRFREWAGFGIVTDGKPNEDIIDILGFLTFEMVQTLTEEALKIKGAEDESKSKLGVEDGGQQGRKNKPDIGLFAPPAEGRTPIGPDHVQEAFRRLQEPLPMERAMRSLSFHHVRQRLLIF